MYTCFHQNMVLCLRTVTSFFRAESDRSKTVIREAEEEVTGYAEAMELVFESADDISMTENHIKQLHSILLKYSSKDTLHIVTMLDINRNTVKKHLKELATKNLIRQNGTGKGTWYSPA